MSSKHIHQSLRLIRVEGVKPTNAEWFECKCGVRVLMSVICESPRPVELDTAAQTGVRVTNRFLAKDNSAWDDLKSAQKRNKELEELEGIEKTFLHPRTPELEQGLGYIQHDPPAIDEFRVRLAKLVTQMLPQSEIRHVKWEPLFNQPEEILSKFDKIISRTMHPVRRLYERLKCIDPKGREWQLPHYAQYPDDGKQTRLNPV